MSVQVQAAPLSPHQGVHSTNQPMFPVIKTCPSLELAAELLFFSEGMLQRGMKHSRK